MNKKAAAATAIVGTGGTGAAVTAATLSSQGVEGESPSLDTLPNSGDHQVTEGGTSDKSTTPALPSPVQPTGPLDVVRKDAKEFLSSKTYRSPFAQINIDSLDTGSDIKNFQMKGSQLTAQEALAGSYGPGHYVFSESSLQIKIDKQIYAGGK